MATLSATVMCGKADLLDHVADPPPQLDRRQRGHVLAVDGDAPAGRLDQAG